MSTFLDELKERLADAQRRLQLAQHEMQTAQAKLQAIAQEFSSLQFLVSSETTKLQQQTNPAASPADSANSDNATHPSNPAEVNKTDLIRGLLRRQPSGMTPTEIWREVKVQMVHRAYLYSVLKRLKDRDEVIVRRGKYITKMVPKTDAGGAEPNFVH